MKLVVAIATLGRSKQIALLLSYLERQSRRPDEVVISAPDATHVELPERTSFPVSVVFGPKGSSAQRNTALDHSLSRFDIVTFFDDDFVPAVDYLERIEAAFAAHPEWSVVMGNVVADGATNAGLTWPDALAAIVRAEAQRPSEPEIVHHIGAYGCNMSVRAAMVGDIRFDERLVLYGWQEDIDFTSQLRRHGPVIQVSTILGVHLGLKSGRVSGERFGYSQVVNPVYLIRKGTVPPTFALPLMIRNLVANFTKSLWPEPYIDRRGRLRGNLLGLVHVLMGRINPEHVLRL